MLKLNNNI